MKRHESGIERSSSGDQSLLLVVPAVASLVNAEIVLDKDFVNNLQAYLDAFSHVTVMCPPLQSTYTFPSTCRLSEVRQGDRLKVVILPMPYREDRYYRHRAKVERLLKDEINRARYILISPHGPFDWSLLAIDICRRLDVPYNMEADWDVPAVFSYMLRGMPLGPKKIRKWLWYRAFAKNYIKALQNSSLSLLQGGDVFDGLASHAPNPFMVLNVQVTAEEHISAASLRRKVDAVASRTPLNIVYAGRADDIKGPFAWLETIKKLHQRGCLFQATWLGDGPRLAELRRFCVDHDLSRVCHLPGAVSREEARARIEAADVFLYCHMTKESPRCLVEALALGTPIVGFGSKYSEGLVARHGGGLFVPVGDSEGLATYLNTLGSDRRLLARLIENAAASGTLLDRDLAIAERIDLMKGHLTRRDADALRDNG